MGSDFPIHVQVQGPGWCFIRITSLLPLLKYKVMSFKMSVWIHMQDLHKDKDYKDWEKESWEGWKNSAISRIQFKDRKKYFARKRNVKDKNLELGKQDFYENINKWRNYLCASQQWIHWIQQHWDPSRRQGGHSLSGSRRFPTHQQPLTTKLINSLGYFQHTLS
jgi:hypothetical protein